MFLTLTTLIKQSLHHVVAAIALKNCPVTSNGEKT